MEPQPALARKICGRAPGDSGGRLVRVRNVPIATNSTAHQNDAMGQQRSDPRRPKSSELCRS